MRVVESREDTIASLDSWIIKIIKLSVVLIPPVGPFLDRSPFPPFPKHPQLIPIPCQPALTFSLPPLILSPLPISLSSSPRFRSRGERSVHLTFISPHAQDIQLYGPGPSWLGTNDADLRDVQTSHRHGLSPTAWCSAHDPPDEHRSHRQPVLQRSLLLHIGRS